MKPSETVIKSELCRQASKKIYPPNPEELFNECWLSLREKELANPDFKPRSPKNYFIASMRYTSYNWKRGDSKKVQITSEIAENPTTPTKDTPCRAYLIEWINEDPEDEISIFYRNIITLALYTSSISEAAKLCGMHRKTFWKYRKEAKKRFYDDYRASGNFEHFDPDLV